ncbi:hypothetical protein ACTWQB_16415, partial [Piscibacillus sp. B03]|uniref:hypothetical protein n=1 Tax=Piscibacillus sp. B03 TaxID=3457430 RepID=UPI003FCDA5C3
FSSSSCVCAKNVSFSAPSVSIIDMVLPTIDSSSIPTNRVPSMSVTSNAINTQPPPVSINSALLTL